jgi:hypothetical protein
MKLWRVLLWTTLLFTLPACSGAGALNDDPARVVERYLQAKVERDAETIRHLLCSEMEAQWQREARTFETVSGATIQGMSCQRQGESGVVRCLGQIVALYGAEQRIFPLGAYHVVQESGEWKWCGEAQ